jgi:AcrR family transcriptional regulator
MKQKNTQALKANHGRSTAGDALIDAARSIFIREGLTGLSLRRVADEAGCTTMAVYTHFGGKKGVISALYDEGFNRLADAQAGALKHSEPRQRLLGLCKAYRKTARKFPHHYALMLGRHSGEFIPSQESAKQALQTFETLVEATEQMLRMRDEISGATVATKARQIASSLFAFCHGWVMLAEVGMLPNKQFDEEYAFERGVEALVSSSF